MREMTLQSMPRFPKTTGMSKEERFTVVTAYLAKVVEYLQGGINEYPVYLRRPHSHSTTGGRLPATVQVEDLLHDSAEDHTIYQAGKECSDQDKRSDEVA